MVDTNPYPDAPSSSLSGISGSAGNLDSISALLGIGAFTVDSGGSTNYGQNITEAFVNSLINGPATMLNQAWTSLESFLAQLGSYLASFELDVLRTLKGFIPGATDADFANVNTAVATILGALNLQFTLGAQEFQDWLNGVYNQLTSQFNQIVDIFNGYVVVPINNEIQAIKDWWNSLGLFQVNTNAAVTNQNSWLSRLITDLTILLDFLHFTYPAGSPSDTPTTTVGGKRTYWSAWNDLMQLIGVVKSAPAPSDTAPTIGQFVQATQTQVISNEATLAQVQADVDSLKTNDTSVAGKKYVSSATVGAGASWGSQWTVSATNANIAPKADIDLFSMTLAPSSSIDLKLTGRFTGGITLTDDQIVSLVFQDAATNNNGGLGPQNVIKARMDAAGTNYIFARVNFTQVQLGMVVGGVETVWQTANGVSVPAGSLIELQCGSTASHREYQVRVNGTPVVSYAETGTSSQMGASYRGGGQDQVANHDIFNGMHPPARVKQFKLQDSNVASSTYGTSARFYRSAATGILIDKGKVQSLGNGVYDTQEYCSPDLQLVSNGFAIFTPGRYRITHAAKVSNAIASPWTWGAVAAGSTSYGALNKTVTGPTTLSYASSRYDLNSVLGLGGTFSFNAIGDGGVAEVWAPAVAISGSGQYSVLGDGAGEGTWVTIERIG